MNEECCRSCANGTIPIAAKVNPFIAKAAAAEIGREAFETGWTITEIVLERRLVDEKMSRGILDSVYLTEPASPLSKAGKKDP